MMKRILLFILSVIILPLITTAQTPQSFKYQAVVRDISGQILANQQVSLRTSILAGGATGEVKYSESHSVVTNSLGLVALNIGEGTVEAGVWTDISWGSDEHFVRIELDASGGANYEPMGTSQLLSVPYALYSQTAEDVDDADADPNNEIQTLSQIGTEISLSNGGGTISVADDDNDATNELELPADPQPGDITYYDGSSWQRLPKGKGGQVLILRNNGTPAWAGKTTEGLLEVILPNSEILYVHPTDNSAAIEWGDIVDISGLDNILSPDTANMDFNGSVNTQAIVTALGDFNSGAYAAKLCADLVAFGFDDWYLPAAGDLNIMYQQLGPAANGFGGSGDITTGSYWSSTERTNASAWGLFFGNGNQLNLNKVGSVRCRCVRRWIK